MKKKIAAIVTVYHKHSHADVIVGKVLEGYDYQGGPGPDLEIAAMYVDQFPDQDMSRGLAKKYGFPIFPTIDGAVTRGTGKLAVDGVLSIGEHGRYPENARGQILYPRRRFFEGIVRVFEKSGRSVPVFNDKHLAATWVNARWMYDKSRELMFPFMAGSSIVTTWRRPPLDFPRGCELEEAVAIGYGPLEGYGFHTLEGLQCLAERRRGGEVGVKSVQFLNGPAMWKAMDDGRWSKPLLEAGLARMSAHAAGDYRKLTAESPDAGVFLIEYRDGFKAAAAILNGYAYEGDGGAFLFAGRLKGRDTPVATQFYQQLFDPFGHFIYLVKAVEAMMRTGHAVYPVERTLLTTGILDAVMISRAEKNRGVETPQLDIRYQPTVWPYATEPVPKVIER